MSCCGERRSTFATEARRADARPNWQTQLAPARQARAASQTPPDQGNAVTLRCLSSSTVIVRGSVTGKRYQFFGGGSMQAVDKRDAEALVATGLCELI